MRVVAIAGVGLIGGSFGLALRAAGFDGTLLGVSSPGTIAEALRVGAIDRGVTLEAAVSEADLLLLAQPISRILSQIDEIGRMPLKPGLWITDAGSTKAQICARARRSLPPGVFVGGHPMAGKEARGVAAADPDLFRGRTWVLTPDAPGLLPSSLPEWIERIGARLLHLTPEQHDAAVALSSHLPQLASTALANTVGDTEVAGPGLLDMTRLARSSWEIWSDILTTNPGPVREALDRYIGALQSMRARLPELEREFESASTMARRLRGC
jgi:prephenate dehydrogenase